jgi:hypothetical protein
MGQIDMFSWFKKVLPDNWVEDESQELSSRAKPPITAEEAFRKWIMSAPAQSEKSKNANTTGDYNRTVGRK